MIIKSERFRQMAKRIIYIIITVVIIGLGSAYYFFLKPSNYVSNTNLFSAVPPESPLIINISNPVDFFDNLNSNELMSSLETISAVKSKIEIAGSFINFACTDEQLYNALKGSQMILSINYSGKDEINLLALIKLRSNSDMDVLNKVASILKTNPQITIETRKYNKVNIHQISTNNATYYLAEQNGIVMISQKSILVEEAIRQIDIDLTAEHPEIVPLLKTMGTQSDLQLFINHSQIDQLFSTNLSKPMKNRSALLKILSGWTELDINLKEDKMLLSGFSNGDMENNFYGNVFLKQQPNNSKIEKVLPQQTTFSLDLSLSDVSAFFSDYESFLEKRNLSLQRLDQLKKAESLCRVNLEELFSKLIDHDIASAGVNIDQSKPESGRIWIVETKSGNLAIAKIIELQSAFLSKSNLNNDGWSKEYQIDAQTRFTIYKFPFANLPQLLFGKIFSGISTNWVTIYDNYLIFGDTFETVAKTVHANILGETLSGSLEYSKLKSNLNSRSTINFYCNTSASLHLASLFFNDKLTSEISVNEELLKFKTFTWQVSSTGAMLYNNACLTYSTEVKSKPQTIWKSHIKSNFDFKPKFVINHTDPTNKEVVLQDNDFNFYLINNVGRIVWQIKLDAPILGEVQQIDYFKNGKFQYVFNTENKLYIVDREGNFVKNFPVNFRAKATNPVAVFDYDNNRDYRLFVACDDKTIYAYQTDGSLLKGWNQLKTDHIVSQAVQHFRVEGKDYIVASDLMKDYILHRTGEVRIKTDQIYPHSANNTLYLEEQTSTHQARIVSTESNGTIHHTYFDGRHETMNNIELSDQHYFVAENIDSDPEMEYVFADKNLVIIEENNGKVILQKKMDTNVSHTPHIYNFSSSLKKIGLTCTSENKIYLFDINGNSHPGFPLDGCTEFSIGFISNDNTNFNLLVGSPDGYLLNYYVE